MTTKIDGNEILINSLETLNINLSALIAETSIWASQEACKQLENRIGSSTRYPNVRRKRHYESKGDIIDGIRFDDNTYANSAIKNAIGLNKKDITNFHTCHIYPNTCYDERYHTKIENLVLIPNSIAQLSDNFDDVKKVLQYRSYELYGWFPVEEPKPEKPKNYPTNWREPIKLNKKLSKIDILNQENETNLEADKDTYLDKENAEIEKVYKRIPKWIQKDKQQINSIILLTFLELLKENKSLSREILKKECNSLVNDFNGNFNQMAQFGEKNHGKVFEVNRDEVRLWEPVAKFILNEYKRNLDCH
jgi:hypothetical protein